MKTDDFFKSKINNVECLLRIETAVFWCLQPQMLDISRWKQGCHSSISSRKKLRNDGELKTSFLVAHDTSHERLQFGWNILEI